MSGGQSRARQSGGRAGRSFSALLIACGALAACATLAGCGAGAPGQSTLSRSSRAQAGAQISWAGQPLLFRPRDLPRDRVILARIRNQGTRTLELFAAQVVVRDARGRLIRGATAAFTNSYAHGLFGALQQPSRLPLSEEARLGRLVYLLPGASAPFYAAWHLPPGAREPVTITVGPSALIEPAVPARFTAR